MDKGGVLRTKQVYEKLVSKRYGESKESDRKINHGTTTLYKQKHTAPERKTVLVAMRTQDNTDTKPEGKMVERCEWEDDIEQMPDVRDRQRDMESL